MYLSCGCHITRFIPPLLLSPHHLQRASKGGATAQGLLRWSAVTRRSQSGPEGTAGRRLQTDSNLRGDSDGPRFTAVSTSTVLPMRHGGNRAEPWVPCATSFGTARQGKEGGFRPPSGHGARSDPSHPCRRSVPRVLGTGLLPNRFRPQSCLTRRVPTARPT